MRNQKSHQWKDRKQETTVMLQRAVTDAKRILKRSVGKWMKILHKSAKKKKDPEGTPDAGKD